MLSEINSLQPNDRYLVFKLAEESNSNSFLMSVKFLPPEIKKKITQDNCQIN